MARIRFSRGRAPDDGFTLVEIILAMFLTVVVMTALLSVLVSSLKTVAQARERQTATALATQSLEQLRALPYDSITGSDATTYPMSAGLEYVTVSGSTVTFTPAAVLPGVSETLVVNEYSGKRATSVVDGVSYVVQTYVTKAPLTTTQQQAFNLTTLVEWTSTVYPTTRTTVQRSVDFSPAGCLSTAQRPFSAPCQAYFTAQSGIVAAGFSVTNAIDSTQDIPGISGHLVELSLPTLSANLQIEQTASGTADGDTSGARAVDTTPSIAGGKSAAVAVDSDPSSTPGQSASTTANQSSGTVSLTGAAGTISAAPTTGDSAAAAAAIAADSTTCRNGDPAGTGLATGPTGQLRPCADASVLQSATSGGITYTSPIGTDVTLVSLGTSSTSSRAVAANLATANPGVACTAGAGATAPGCAHAMTSRSLGDVVVGRPGTGSGPLDVNKGLFNVTGLTESARSEEGTGAGAPQYSRAGTLQYWNGTGYTSVDLSAYASPPSGLTPASDSWTIDPVTTVFPDGLHVTMEGSVTVQRPQITTSGPADCTAQACVAQVNGGGSVRATTVFTVTDASGVEVTKFVLVSDLGGLVAQSTYKAAANG